MNSLVLGIATYKEPEEGTQWYKEYHECTESWNNEAWQHRPVYEVLGMRIIPAYNEIWQKTTEDIIFYVHNDTISYPENEPWDLKILKEFDIDPTVGIVCLFGAQSHCSPSLYKEDFRISNMARGRCVSNIRTHGIASPLSDSKNVVVCDGYAMAVRRELLDKTGGWNSDATYFLYTEAMCIEARKYGYRLKAVGIDHDHLGGRTSTHANITDSFDNAHRWLYETYRDWLPASVD